MLHKKRRMFSKTMINETKVKKLVLKMCGSVEEGKIYLPDIFIDVQKNTLYSEERRQKFV